MKKSIPSRFGRYARSDEASGEADFRERIQTDLDRDIRAGSLRAINAKHGDPYAGMSVEEASEFNRKLGMTNIMNHPVNQNIPDKEIPYGYTLETMPQDMLEEFYRERYQQAMKEQRMAERQEPEPTEMEDLYSQAFSQIR